MTSEGQMDHLSPRWKTIKRAKEGRGERWRNLSSLLIALPRYFSTGRFPLHLRLLPLFKAWNDERRRNGGSLSKRRALGFYIPTLLSSIVTRKGKERRDLFAGNGRNFIYIYIYDSRGKRDVNVGGLFRGFEFCRK